MKISARARLISIIVAVVFMFGALAGTGAYLIVNHINNANAATSTNYIIEDNLYNTDGTINRSAVLEFLTAIGYMDNPNDTGTYEAHQILSRNNAEDYANDDAIIFKMGYYTEKDGTSTYTTDLVWQATYLWNGYLTIWMSNPYTSDYYNYGTSTANGWGDEALHNSTDYSNYSRSTLRDITNNIYTALSTSLDNFSDFIVSPREASATWQATQAEDVNAYRYSSAVYWYAHHNGLQSYSGIYTGWAQDLWDSEYPPYNDKFWIPSYVEVYATQSYTASSTGWVSNDGGLWGLTADDKGYGTSTQAYDGSNDNSSCWLRSSISGAYMSNGTGRVIRVLYNGYAGYSNVSSSYGIRPAAHISLSALADNTPYVNINANATPNLNNFIQVNQTSLIIPMGSTLNTPQTFTYTATNYTIDQITINELTFNYSNIPTSAGSFQSGNGFEYRVYRNENRSICYVQLQNVYTDVTITATQASPTIDISIENNAVTINSFDRATLDNTTATIYAQQNMAYTQRFRLPGQNWVDISTTASGDGFVGDIHYSYTTANNVITLYFENITAGEVFEITFGGEEKLLAYSAVGGSATFSEFIDNEGYTNVVIAPQAGYYVHSIIVDNVAFNVEYYRAEIMGAGNARIIGYTVKDTNNMLDLWLVGQYAKSTIVFNLVQGTPPNYKTPSTGGAVTGTVVTATNGGEARIVGFDYDNTTDDENVTFIAVNYTGYAFSGWSVDGEILDGYGMSASIPYTLVKDKIVTAVFTPISNNNANDSTDNNFDDMI